MRKDLEEVVEFYIKKFNDDFDEVKLSKDCYYLKSIEDQNYEETGVTYKDSYEFVLSFDGHLTVLDFDLCYTIYLGKFPELVEKCREKQFLSVLRRRTSLEK